MHAKKVALVTGANKGIGFATAASLARLGHTVLLGARDSGGADWDYRSILERTLAAAEHFTGDGTSKPTLVGAGKTPRGYPEFLGPNRQLTALPELAVIDLGALRIAE